MGVGGEKPAMKEISETKASYRDEQFELIIERVKSSGGEVTKDESSPLFIEVGNQEFEIGTQRVVEFSLNRKDFKLTRNVENHSLQGAGLKKHLEPLESPRIKLTLRIKDPGSQDWQIVDLEDMF